METPCADPGILVRRVQAQRPESSLDNVVFLVLNLFYSLQRGSNGFNTEKTILFQDPEGVQHFPGGGGGGGGGSKC